MLELITENFSVHLAVLIVSLIPGIESKVAIPFGLSKPIWAEATLSPFMALLISFSATVLPSILIIFLSRKLKNKTSGFVHDKFIMRLQNHFRKDFDKIGQKSSVLKKCFVLGTFVAIPLPLTGIYTGSLIAGFTNLKIWQCWLAVLIGELVSCIGIVLICTLFENSAFYILIMTLILCAIMILFNVLLSLFHKFRRK